MSSQAVIQSPLRNRTANVMSSPLARAVDLLAEGVQRSMVALYALQTALINVLARHRGSKFLLEDVERIRSLFRQEWEKVILLVQHVYRYSDDYITLCEFVVTEEHSSAASWAYFQDVMSVSQDVLTQTRDVKMRHDRLNKELVAQRNKLTSALTNTWSSPEIPKSVKLKSPSTDNISTQFYKAAQASLNPDGRKALDDSFDSLRQVSTALGDLFNFWKDHHDQLVAIQRHRDTLPFTSEELGQLADSWKNEQSVLLAAISSISSSSDAMTVNATGDPAYAANERARGFWRLFKEFLRRFGL